MRTRARAAAATRAGILEAAHRLLNQRDSTTLTLQEVAAAAGVSRATIYKSVGSRVRLLAAVFEDQGRLIGFDRVLAAMEEANPARAVVTTIRESCRAWSVMPDAIRKTLALAALDEEIGQLVRNYERHRRARLAALARRVCGAGARERNSECEKLQRRWRSSRVSQPSTNFDSSTTLCDPPISSSGWRKRRSGSRLTWLPPFKPARSWPLVVWPLGRVASRSCGFRLQAEDQ